MTRLGAIERRYDNQNPLYGVAKAHAMSEDTVGVPLTELGELIGNKITLDLAQASMLTTGWRFTDPRNVALLPANNAFTESFLSTADLLTITLKLRDITNREPTIDYIYSIFADDWHQLTAAEAGDTLSPPTTGLRLRTNSERDGAYREIIIGRTETNQVLIVPHQFFIPLGGGQFDVSVDIDFSAYTGGLLGRRIAEIRSFDLTHRLAYKTRSASAPDAPGAADIISYDGFHDTLADGTVWVRAAEDDPPGDDTLYYAATTADFNQINRTWTIDFDSFIVASTAPTQTIPTPSFQIQFSATENGAYHHPRQDGDQWVRMRLDDGAWSYFPFDHDHHYIDRNWRLIASRYLGGQPSGNYGRFEVDFRPSDYRWIYASFTHSDGYIGITPAIASDEINVYGRLGNEWQDLRGNMVFGFPEDAGSYIRKDQNALGEGFRFIARFEAGTDGDSGRVRSIAYAHYQTNTRGVFTLRGL